MKKLLILFILTLSIFSFNYTNASNIDYSKTQIKVSGKYYTLDKVKDLLYKSINKKIALKTDNNSKIELYNKYINLLNSLSSKYIKSTKETYKNTGYMLADLKDSLSLDLEKISNNESENQILDNNEEGVNIDSNIKIITYLDIHINQGLGGIKGADGKTFEETNNIYKSLLNKYYSNGKIPFDLGPAELINRENNLLINGIDIETIKNQRIKTSENGGAKIIRVNLEEQGDGRGIEIIEYYDNGESFGYGYSGMGYSDQKTHNGNFHEIKAFVTRVNGQAVQWSYSNQTSNTNNEEGVNIDSNVEIITNYDGYLKKGIITDKDNIFRTNILNEVNKVYSGFISMNTAPAEIIDKKDNLLIDGIDTETIKNQRIKTSENGKAKIIKVSVFLKKDGMAVEIIEYYDNGESFGYGYSGIGYKEATTQRANFREVEAFVTRVNGQAVQWHY